MADLANRLRRQRHHAGDPGCTDAFRQLQQRHGPQHDSHLLNATAQQLPQLLLVLLVTSIRRAGRAIPQVCAKTFLIGIVLLESFQAVRDLASTDTESGLQIRDQPAAWAEAALSVREAIPRSPLCTWRSGSCSRLLRPASTAAPLQSGRAAHLPSCSAPLPDPASPAWHAPLPCDRSRDAMDNKCLLIPQYGCSVADLYHGERNHQGKGNQLLFPERGPIPKQRDRSVECHHRLGGLLKYYGRAA